MASTQNPASDTTEDAAPDDATTRQLLLFGAGGRTLGCDIAAVREIIPFRRCTRLPGAPTYVCGLTNLRGTVVTVVDLAARLADAPAPAAAASEAGAAAAPWGSARTDGSIILAELGTKVVGLAVDGVRDVQTLAEGDVEEVSDGGAAAALGGANSVVCGLARLGDEVVTVLDVRTILKQVLA